MENTVFKKSLVFIIIILFIGVSIRQISGFTNEKIFSINNIASSEENNRYYSISQSVWLDTWWNNDWGYRKLITINSSMVESTLSNFPVLINQVTDPDLVSHAQSDGDDIAFVQDSDNTQLNHEIEKYNGTTGELVAWVNVTGLSSSVDTNIWMYYGNSGCSSQQNPTGVWDSNYVGVWHMDDNTSSSIADSTSYNYDGTKEGANQPIQSIGKIGYAQDFDNDTIDTADISEIELSSATFSFWGKIDDTIKDHDFVTKGQHNTQQPLLIWFDDYVSSLADKGGLYTNSLSVLTGNDTTMHWVASANNSIMTTDWYYYTVVINPSTGEIRIYINGSLSNNNTKIWNGINDTTTLVRFGNPTPVITQYLHGMIDEVRISKIARNSSWIITSYNTMNSPDTFYSLDNEEIQPKIIVSNPYPPDGATDVEITPTMVLTVNHTQGNQINITWKWNNSGSWDVFGTNYNVFNGTYNQINMNFSSYLITYEWHVEINDGIGNWWNKTYSFTTIGETEPPTINIIIPRQGFLYINLFGNQYEIPFHPLIFTLIIGKIDITVNATDNDGIKWVKFYINDELRATIYEESYTWTWNQTTIIFPFTIKVIACDYSGNENSNEINVWKIQLF